MFVPLFNTHRLTPILTDIQSSWRSQAGIVDTIT
jgi:hypothetical protein